MRYFKIIFALSFWLTLSALLGFVRELLIAKKIGVSASADVFVMALTGVSFVYLLFNPSNIQAIFIPIYQPLLKSNFSWQARNAFMVALKMLIIVLAILFIAVVFAKATYSSLLAPGFNSLQQYCLQDLITILSPLIVLYGIGSLFHALCHAHHNFKNPLIGQILNNLMIVLGLYFMNDLNIIKLSWIFLFGGIIYFAVMLYSIKPYFMSSETHRQMNMVNTHWVKENIHFKSQLVAQALPLFILVMTEQVIFCSQRIIATSLETGSASSLHYAFKLANFPVNIFAMAISTVSFPLFVQQFGLRLPGVESLFKKGILGITFLLLPISLLFIFCSEEIVTMLFLRGNFDMSGVDKTASALSYYGLGIMAQGYILFLNRLYCADRQGKSLVKISLFCIIVQVLLSYSLGKTMGHAGVALATSITACIHVLILCGVRYYPYYRKRRNAF